MSVTWVEAIGFVAGALNVWGNLMLAQMRTAGWVVRLCTNLVWIWYAWYAANGLPVMVNHLLFLVVNVFGWVKWHRAARAGSLQPAVS